MVAPEFEALLPPREPEPRYTGARSRRVLRRITRAKKTIESFDTIVIGAGVAGLTAAQLLARNGQRVVVLEARDRVGGRLHSEHSSERVTDLGGSWIHGITDSPVHAAATAFGMPMHEFTVGSYQTGRRPIAYYGPDGERLNDAARSEFVADVAAVDRALTEHIAALPAGASYADAADTTVATVAESAGWSADRAERVTEYLYHRSEEQYGADASILDAHGLDDDWVDGDEVVFPQGYDALPISLAHELDVRFSHEVREVRWSDTGSTVITADKSFSAARVVVTVPVGVLQSEKFTLAPPLPEPVAGALAGLRMNAFEKIFLRFDEQFWDEDVYAIRRQGDAAEWWHSWYDLTALHGEPTLLTFAAGACAQEIRTWSDEQITASVMQSLREIFSDASEPSSVRITRWQDDPYAHGSYAYMTLGSTPEDHEIIATPLGTDVDPRGVLHLAGEATWQEDPATVTAALCSGHRAAERILGRSLEISDLWSA